MITVEYDDASNDVAIAVDAKGAELLVEFLQHFMERGTEDHVHFLSGPEEHEGFDQPPEYSALSLKKLSKGESFKVADMLTIYFRC